MIPSGTILQGRYQVVRSLGSGGFSTVYLAEDLRLAGRFVAVKENQDASPSAIRAFRQEAELLARLQHPNLPRVTDHFREPSGYQYLVMDYIEGENLDVWVKYRSRMDEASALAALREVIDAVAYLHGQQPPIIHRDIKPSNLIQRHLDGKIILVDFGIAKQQMAGGGTLTGARAATPGYAPPEQYVGRTDERSDIYALGATLYFLLTGMVPPEAPGRAAGYDPLTSPRQINPHISPNTEQTILRAMEIDTSRRWATVQNMAGALLAEQQIPTVSLNPSRGSRLGRIAVGAGLILAPLALAGLLAWRPWHQPAGPAVRETSTVLVAGADTPFVTSSAMSTDFSLEITSPTPTDEAPQIIVERTATPTQRPTSTPVPAMPTDTPTLPSTATPTPTSIPVPRMQTISLARIANDSSEGGYANPPLGSVTLGGVPFDLPAGRNSITTQAETLPNNPTRISQALQAANPQRVYLLLTGGNLFSRYANATVGVVRLRFASEAVQEEWLVAGYNIREWKIFDQATVSSNSAGNVQQVWSGESLHGGTGVIDMLTIEVAPDHRTSILVAVELEDISTSSVDSKDPAINWLGLTVLGHDQMVAAPEAVPCLVGDVFESAWASRQERLGCARGAVETTTYTIQPFERGYLVWSERSDQIYILPEGANWSQQTNAWQPDQDVFSCDEARSHGQPMMGFGKLWCDDMAIRRSLGLPLDQEKPDNNGKLQFFEDGFAIRVHGGRIFVFYDDKTWDTES